MSNEKTPIDLLSPFIKSYWESHQFKNALTEEGNYIPLENAINIVNSLQSTLTTVTAERDRYKQAIKNTKYFLEALEDQGIINKALNMQIDEALSQSEKGENENER